MYIKAISWDNKHKLTYSDLDSAKGSVLNSQEILIPSFMQSSYTPDKLYQHLMKLNERYKKILSKNVCWKKFIF